MIFKRIECTRLESVVILDIIVPAIPGQAVPVIPEVTVPL